MHDRPPETDPRLARELRAYGALDNPVRLRAYRVIHDVPNVPFNELVRRLGVASGLAGYHLGVLKAAALIDVEYVRKGMATSEYRLTDLGTQIYENLFGKRSSRPKRLAKSVSKVLA